MIVDIVNYNRHCQWATTQYTVRTQEVSSIFETTLTKLSFPRELRKQEEADFALISDKHLFYTLSHIRTIWLLILLVLLVVLFYSLVLVLDIRRVTMLNAGGV